MFCKILFGKALFLLPLLYGGHATASCFGYQAEKISGKALEGHVSRVVNLNEAECNNLCFGTLNCLSINHYAGESDGRQNVRAEQSVQESRAQFPGPQSWLQLHRDHGELAPKHRPRTYSPLGWV